MESARAHRAAGLPRADGCVRIFAKAGAMGGRRRGHLHLQRAVIFLVALTMQPQVSHRLSAISGSMPFKTTTDRTSSVIQIAFVCCFLHLNCAKAPPRRSRRALSPPSPHCPLSCSSMALRPPVVSARCFHLYPTQRRTALTTF